MHISGTNRVAIAYVLSLIVFQKCDGHTYIHTAAYPWPIVRDPMPRANALRNTSALIFVVDFL